MLILEQVLEIFFILKHFKMPTVDDLIAERTLNQIEENFFFNSVQSTPSSHRNHDLQSKTEQLQNLATKGSS